MTPRRFHNSERKSAIWFLLKLKTLKNQTSFGRKIKKWKTDRFPNILCKYFIVSLGFPNIDQHYQNYPCSLRCSLHHIMLYLILKLFFGRSSFRFLIQFHFLHFVFYHFYHETCMWVDLYQLELFLSCQQKVNE